MKKISTLALMFSAFSSLAAHADLRDQCRTNYTAAWKAEAAAEKNGEIPDEATHLAQAKSAITMCANYYASVGDIDTTNLLLGAATFCTNRNSQNSGLAAAYCRMKFLGAVSDADGLLKL